MGNRQALAPLIQSTLKAVVLLVVLETSYHCRGHRPPMFPSFHLSATAAHFMAQHSRSLHSKCHLYAGMGASQAEWNKTKSAGGVGGGVGGGGLLQLPADQFASTIVRF